MLIGIGKRNDEEGCRNSNAHVVTPSRLPITDSPCWTCIDWKQRRSKCLRHIDE
jgi:hypothetical protein